MFLPSNIGAFLYKLSHPPILFVQHVQHVQPPVSQQPDQKRAAVASLASLASTATPGDQSMQAGFQMFFWFHHMASTQWILGPGSKNSCPG